MPFLRKPAVDLPLPPPQAEREDDGPHAVPDTAPAPRRRYIEDALPPYPTAVVSPLAFSALRGGAALGLSGLLLGTTWAARRPARDDAAPPSADSATPRRPRG